MSPPDAAERITAYLASAPGPASLRQVCEDTGVTRTRALAHLGALEQAGRLRVTRPRGGVAYQLIPAAVVPRPVEVDANDLDLLLGHYYDEVLGSPDRSHWTFPQLRAAAGRLAAATRPDGA